jgi:prevent-host-death family protein
VPDAVQHVEQDDVRVVLTRDGQPVAAIVPLHDLRSLEEMDAAEDEHLSRLADEAIDRWNAAGRPEGASHDALLIRYGINPDSA